MAPVKNRIGRQPSVSGDRSKRLLDQPQEANQIPPLSGLQSGVGPISACESPIFTEVVF
jgi:hypothetical protein